jgi:Mg2+ and Co2+ transporter CorA
MTKQDRIELMQQRIRYYIGMIEVYEDRIKEYSDEIIKLENEEEIEPTEECAKQ